jgi:hypothetical protein
MKILHKSASEMEHRFFFSSSSPPVREMEHQREELASGWREREMEHRGVGRHLRCRNGLAPTSSPASLSLRL